MLKCNLVSVGSLTNEERNIVFINKKNIILDDKIIKNIWSMDTKDHSNGIYKFIHKPQSTKINLISKNKNINL